jgi:hypothetical protein
MKLSRRRQSKAHLKMLLNAFDRLELKMMPKLNAGL